MCGAGRGRRNAAGKIVQWEWQHLGQRFPQVQLGSFIVMPNHIHAVIIIIKNTVGATQAGQIGRVSGEDEQSNMDMSGNGGSPRVARGQSGDGDSDGRDGATRMGQMDVWEEDVPLPDEAILEMGGSPLRMDDGVSVYESSQPGDVGATQAGQTGRNSAEGKQSNMGVSGNDGSPRVGRGDSGDDGGLGGRDGATRMGQMGVWEEDVVRCKMGR